MCSRKLVLSDLRLEQKYLRNKPTRKKRARNSVHRKKPVGSLGETNCARSVLQEKSSTTAKWDFVLRAKETVHPDDNANAIMLQQQTHVIST